MMQQFKQRTRQAHEQVEANPRMARLMAPGVTREDYASLLASLLGFHEPLEARLLAHPARETVEAYGLDLDERVKAPALRRDLEALGWRGDAIAALPHCHALPPLATADHVFGCLYVLEGATLGGQIIGRHIGNTLGLDADTGAEFYGVYGERVGPMWRAFGRAAEARASAPSSDPEAAIASASATFSALDAWLTATRSGQT